MLRPGRLVLIGASVSRSLSPRLHNAALRAAGIPLTYATMDVSPAELDATLDAFRREDVAGNVTIPHKEQVAARCDRLTPLARRCGAVNVFWHEDGALVGDNSDVGGVDHVLRALVPGGLAGARVALIGAGGAAAAVLAAVERWEGATATVYNRHMPRARQLADRFSPIAKAVATPEDALAGATLVVNATPTGTRDEDPFPVPLGLLPDRSAVFDLVIRAADTAWVRAARDAGHPAADGRGMLVEQAALAFERWFGRSPDRDAMWAAMP